MAATSAKLLSAVLGILILPIIMHQIGKEQFGLWMVVSSLVVWMQLADFGIGNGLVNALSEANGRDDPEAASGYLSSGLVATIVLALVCLPFLYAAYLWIPWGRLLNISEPDLAEIAADAFLIVGFFFILNIPISLVNRVYVAYQKGYVTQIAQGIASIAVFAGVLAAVYIDLDFLYFVGISAGLPVLINAILWIDLFRVNSPIKIDLYSIGRVFFIRISNSSIPLFIFQCGGLLVNQLVYVVIANLGTLAMVAEFNIVQRIYIFIFSLAAAISSPFYPAIREASERDDSRWMAKAISNALWLRLLATSPFALILLFFGDYLVIVWMGPELSPLGIWGWICVILTLFLSAVSSLLGDVLNGLDDIWPQIGLVMVSAVIVISSMFFMIPIWGVAAVFVAMSLSTFFPIIWSFLRIRSRVLGLT